ncbi:MAG TPA: ABC transporter substrate-binding protein [Stellaceae bacterium]|jgi:phospholipid transport system substrate-binding protein|nr:ABC transporter substrate-binding protein [Stellaceae bacterium]
MIARRTFFAALLAAAAPVRPLRAADAAPPQATVSAFYAALLATMKDGPALGFKGRSERLAPAIRRAFDLPLMTRLMVGPQWAGLPPDQQQQLVAAFTEFSIATYANRFDDYSGERFEVEPTTTPATTGVIVHSKLIKGEGDSVQLDYLIHETDEGWQIVDVYLSGTVSELATRRSEFSSVMRRGGAGALVDLLQKKAAELRS